MPRSKPLSNRQRELQRKAVQPKPRKTAPGLAVFSAPAEPRGEAARQAVLTEVRAREALRGAGPKDVTFDAAGYIRASNRDGVGLLYRTKTLSEAQTKAALAFRMAYVASKASLRSCLGKAGEGGGGGKLGGLVRSAADLQRAYLMARLNQMERAVGEVMVDGRELHALRMIAGEGQTVREVAGASGHARAATVAALVRSLDAIAKALRITGQ